jgi:Uma2 family endonuclease
MGLIPYATQEGETGRIARASASIYNRRVSSAAPRRHYTYGEYLALDEASNVRLEFYAGDIYAMAGGTPEHAALCLQVGSSLNVQLEGRPCRVYGSDLRVRVRASGLATYPDVSVVCGPLERDPEGRDTVLNPTLVVEVLSPSTADYDCGEKREHCQQIPSLREVVLVAHDQRRIEVYRRGPNGWSHDQAGPGESVVLESISCRLDVDTLYERAGA